MDLQNIRLSELTNELLKDIKNPVLKEIVEKNLFRIQDSESAWSEYDKYQEYADSIDHWDNAQ
jgi:hypothetical protein